jgi:hypothetical protein
MNQSNNLRPFPGLAYGLAGTGTVGLIVAIAAMTSPQSATALPNYAQQTGQACGRCHVNPAGGGKLTGFGAAFQANGHKMPSKGGTEGKKPSGGVSSAPSTTSPTPAQPAVSGSNGGYYSGVVNPTFGYVPELSYSNSVDIKIYPHSN